MKLPNASVVGEYSPAHASFIPFSRPPTQCFMVPSPHVQALAAVRLDGVCDTFVAEWDALLAYAVSLPAVLPAADLPQWPYASMPRAVQTRVPQTFYDAVLAALSARHRPSPVRASRPSPA